MRPNPREKANGLIEVWWFGCSRFQNATGKTVVITFSDRMTLYLHSINDKSHLAPDYERCSRPSAPTRSLGHYIQ
jgi:hypothetical protein